METTQDKKGKLVYCFNFVPPLTLIVPSEVFLVSRFERSADLFSAALDEKIINMKFEGTFMFFLTVVV